MFKLKKFLSEYLCAATGTFILAFAISYFHAPFSISTGGVSGVAITLDTLFKIPKSVSTLIINLVLFCFGFKTLKKSALIKTVVSIFMLSGFLAITDPLTDFLYSSGMNFGNDIIISTIFGGVFVGVGVGLTVLVEASTGGSDFAAIILHKIIPHIGVAFFILIIDSVVIISSGLVIGDISLMFYSALSLYISTKLTDFILVRGNFAKSVYVISKKSTEIASEIMEKMKRGVTGIYSKGYYFNSDSMMLMCIVKSSEVPNLLKMIKKHDRLAFTIISDVKEVHGEGFQETV